MVSCVLHQKYIIAMNNDDSRYLHVDCSSFLLSSGEVQRIVTNGIMYLNKEWYIREVVKELNHTFSLMVQSVNNLHEIICAGCWQIVCVWEREREREGAFYSIYGVHITSQSLNSYCCLPKQTKVFNSWKKKARQWIFRGTQGEEEREFIHDKHIKLAYKWLVLVFILCTQCHHDQKDHSQIPHALL